VGRETLINHIFSYLMNKRKLDNDSLDLIGKRLIRSGSVPPDTIDRIVSDPELFSRVRMRIADDRQIPANARLYPVFRNIAAGFACVVVIAVLAITVIKLNQTPVLTVANVVLAPAEMPVEARPNHLPPLRAGSNPTLGRAFDRETGPQTPAVRNASYAVPRRRQSSQAAEASEFYPISNDGVESAAGGHIVRVDMSRASLFALGVNVPLENDSETVRADLLVGPDGVTRAIRVLK
jgi:hypothetical protein